MTTARRGPAVAVRRLRWDAGVAICVTLAGSLAAIAFIGNGGLQLGSSTLVEIAVILAAGLLVAAALVFAAADTPLYGGASLAAVAGLAAITALSILWSLHPADSWIETNRTLAYLAAFAGGIAAVRLFPRRWDAVLYGVLIALAVVCLYGLATKVAPGWLAEDEVYARLREPYGYWNAVGVTAAMGIPICLWLGTREGSPLTKALAYPLLGSPVGDDAAELLARQHPGRGCRHRVVAGARAAAALDARRPAARPSRPRRWWRRGRSARVPSPTTAWHSPSARTRASPSA